ncbi:hypothetical protein BPUM_3174 [Bacillus pumilus SAFR-032]|uniref:Uncharacterized protein n=1 Tax=Bacillus pumilus (strain SAFR-032) TaxID=315750 RepID=A8FHW1_BACP2|nr:hypothetical protein BPUM_3174 [Bacillus pumilus SAFR-032]
MIFSIFFIACPFFLMYILNIPSFTHVPNGKYADPFV